MNTEYLLYLFLAVFFPVVNNHSVWKSRDIIPPFLADGLGWPCPVSSALKRSPVQDFNYFSIIFYCIISTTYQKIGDLFCPVHISGFSHSVSVRYDFDYALEKHISKCIVGSGEFISGNSQNCNMCIVFYQTYYQLWNIVL